MQAEMQSTEEFVSRFGDVIDDRVAEVLDEILAERDALRPRWRLRPGMGALALLLAAAESVVLRHIVLAVCVIWLGAAVVCLAAARTTGHGRL
jgi:hypothetical protein